MYRIHLIIHANASSNGGGIQNMAYWTARCMGANGLKAVVADRLDLTVFMDSNVEGVVIILIEASAMAKIIIGADTVRIPDVIKDGRSGILIKPWDVEYLTYLLDSILSNPVKFEHEREYAKITRHRGARLGNPGGPYFGKSISMPLI
ncbi:glycosyltransferase [bacterium]|nr:glycosyltransferase [bacterium]